MFAFATVALVVVLFARLLLAAATAAAAAVGVAGMRVDSAECFICVGQSPSRERARTRATDPEFVCASVFAISGAHMHACVDVYTVLGYMVHNKMYGVHSVSPRSGLSLVSGRRMEYARLSIRLHCTTHIYAVERLVFVLFNYIGVHCLALELTSGESNSNTRTPTLQKKNQT